MADDFDLKEHIDFDVEGMTAEQIIEGTMQRHLGIALVETARVMCMCHAADKAVDAIFEGPVYHRRHVAGIAVTKLRKAGLV